MVQASPPVNPLLPVGRMSTGPPPGILFTMQRPSPATRVNWWPDLPSTKFPKGGLRSELINTTRGLELEAFLLPPAPALPQYPCVNVQK